MAEKIVPRRPGNIDQSTFPLVRNFFEVSCFLFLKGLLNFFILLHDIIIFTIKMF